jgi:hypothetical protein
MQRSILPAFLFLLLIRSVSAETDISRFYKALRAFNYPTYISSDRDVYFDFNYNASRSDTASSLFEGDEQNKNSSNYSSDISSTLEFKGRYTKIRPVYRMDCSLSISGLGSYAEISTVNADTILGSFDSTMI